MDKPLLRAYLVELLATFAFVLLAGGLSCVNVMTTPRDTAVGASPLTLQQPGLVGLALGQGLVWLALVAWSAPITGGYLNPAIAMSRWVFGRLPTIRMAWMLGAQVIGAVVAGLVLRSLFSNEILRTAHFGAPYLNPAAFGDATQAVVWSGLFLELVLTFFFVLAMFTPSEKSPTPWLGAAASGAILVGATLFAGPLTGAGLNPARWFGPAFWEMIDGVDPSPMRAALAYVAGPIVGALAAGAFAAGVYLPAKAETSEPGGLTETRIKK